MLIGDRVKTRRKQLNLSQSELGNLIGVSKVAISGYENGFKTPSLSIFEKLVETLEVDPNFLLGYDVNVVSSDDIPYGMAKQDIQIIRDFKEKPSLYRRLYNDSKRMVELIERKVK